MMQPTKCPKCQYESTDAFEICPMCGTIVEKYLATMPKTPAPSGKIRQCPFCGEDILAVAIKCKHCGSNLVAPQVSASSQVGLSALFSAKVRDSILIAVACLSVLAFFMPNAVVTIPIMGKMRFSMYDVTSQFIKKSMTYPSTPRTYSGTQDNASQPDITNVLGSEKGIGGIVCLVAVLGLMLHYFLSIVWCICRVVSGKVSEGINRVWLVGVIQFPVLLTVGSSIILASMKKEMAQKEANEFAAAMGNALMNSFSIDAGLIMWVLCLVALCGLAMPAIARKMTVVQIVGNIPLQPAEQPSKVIPCGRKARDWLKPLMIFLAIVACLVGTVIRSVINSNPVIAHEGIIRVTGTEGIKYRMDLNIMSNGEKKAHTVEETIPQTHNLTGTGGTLTSCTFTRLEPGLLKVQIFLDGKIFAEAETSKKYNSITINKAFILEGS